MSKFLRAQDIIVTFRRDGIPIRPLSFNSGTFTHGLGMEEVPVTGSDVPEVDGINGIKQLTLDANPRSPDMMTLFEIFEAKNRGDDEFLDTEVDATFSMNWKRSGRKRYIMPQVVISDTTTTFGGSTDRVTQSLTLSSQRVKAV